MKISKAVKYSVLATLVLGGAVGCAGTPTQEPQQPVSETPAKPSRSEAVAAIEAARAALNEAKAADALWRDTEALLAEAEKALAAGDTERAIELAGRVQREAENALAQKRSEEATMRGQEALGKASAYTVERGDSLWRISGKDEIYGNPYQWPLIYKANRDQIRDADLIYPGQVFAIERNATQADIDAAVRHARTRGAWSLGTVEESDRQYLMR